MKNRDRLLLLAVASLVVVVSVAHARRGRPVIIDPVTVNPLAGYAGQIYNDDAPVISTLEEGSSFGSSLLDEPSQ